MGKVLTMKAPLGTRLDLVMRRPLYPFQQEGVEQVEACDGRALICDEQGLGKTPQSIAWAAIHPEVRPVIVVCPSSVKWSWAREWKRFAGLKSFVIQGRTISKEQTKRVLRAQIVIINYDVVTAWLKVLLKLKAQLLILDECHFLRNRGAKRTKACTQLSKRIPHVIPLSGTPIEGKPIEFFPVLHMVRPREFSSFWKYGMEWCGPTVGWGGRMDFSGASNLRGLHRRLKTFVIRRMKKDVLRDLPAKQRTVLPVDIKNRKEYDEAEENFLSWLLEKKGKAAFKRALRAEAVVKMGNLKQLAAQGKLPHVIEWIEDFLRSSTEKLLVFAIHKKMLGGLKKAFPKALLIDGSVSNNKRKGQTTSDRQRLIDLFQQGKRHRLLFCQLRAMGVGTTLTAASSVLKTELGWTPGEHEQGEDRVHRIGQKKQVHIYYMVGRKTIEERVLAVLQKKGEVTRRILDGKKGAVMRLLDMFLKEVQ